MKLKFVNIMQELRRFDTTAYITQPPIPLAVLAAVTPPEIETGLLDEQTDCVTFDGDVFAFSVSTQNACAVYRHADGLRAAGKKVIMGGIHVTVCPEEALQHADSIVTGEAETIWPEVCADLLGRRLEDRYAGTPTPSSRMKPVDYRFFGGRRYMTPAALFATRGCNRRCSFCVSSKNMGPYRVKPLEVLEREIHQLNELYPSSFLMFTDDNLLVSPRYRAELLAMLRRKNRRFVTMVTVDQFCDPALMEEMAASGCLGVAVGVESVDADNCTAVSKYQNLDQPFSDAVHFANELGIQVGALLMVGLPHDSPDRLANTVPRLGAMGCASYDFRILRVYPSTPQYARMVSSGEVTENWWLNKDSDVSCNHLLPSCLGMHFKHPHFTPIELQQLALRLTAELNAMNHEAVSHILRVGRRGRALKFAALILAARRQTVRQARALLTLVDKTLTSDSAARAEEASVALQA